jgi:L-arabinokinase
VLRAVRELAPGLPITVVSSAPESLFRRAIPPLLEYRRRECDVGLVQRDALTIDEAGTAEAWLDFSAGWDARVTDEARWLAASDVRLVLGDIPPLAFEAAARAGVASVALANFSWDWIYRHLARREPRLAEAAERCARAYESCSLLLRLPFAGDLSAFPRIEDVPLVARRPGVAREEARRRLDLRGDRPLVLLSFGGIGMSGFDASVLEGLPFHFVSVGPCGTTSAFITELAPRALEAAGLQYQDLVGAVDVVVTKPGYGIVTDAIGAGARLVYTDRGDFPEYPILVAEMTDYLPCAYVSNADLLTGRLLAPIRAVLGKPAPTRPDLSGASRVAERLLELQGR